MQFVNWLVNAPAVWVISHHIGGVLGLGVLFAGLAVDVLIVGLLGLGTFVVGQFLRLLLARYLRNRLNVDTSEEPVFLELTFPADTTKSAQATEQLHILLRGQTKPHTILEAVAGAKQRYSFELVATREEGIRYIMMVSGSTVDRVTRSLLSFMPELKIREASDYLSEVVGSHTEVVELRLSGHFALPLESHEALDQHDPIAHIAGHMTKLSTGELMAFQIVVSPVTKSTHVGVHWATNRLRKGIALGSRLSTRLAPWRQSDVGRVLWVAWYLPLRFIGRVIKTVFVLPAVLVGRRQLDTLFAQDMGNAKKQLADPYEIELATVVKAKLDQHLFEVTIRILTSAPDGDSLIGRTSAIVSSFATFSNARQSLKVRELLPISSSSQDSMAAFTGRLHGTHVLSQATILSSSELSGLYHFPNTDTTKTEGLVKSRSRELPVPLSLKDENKNFDVVVGVNNHGGESSPIGLTVEQRQKHTYIIGKTGMGKTTLLTSVIYQDMVAGKGLAVLDPHGDMFHDLIGLVPDYRRKDIVVFDPSDRAFPVGLNILDPGIDFANSSDRRDWITSSVISVFKKLALVDQWGPRMEHILRNATLSALYLPGPTLYTIQRLLTEPEFQKEAANLIADPILRQFWNKEFALAGSMQMASATAPLTNRLGQFFTSTMSRNILLQERTTLRIQDIMDEGKILLVNLSKGDLGEDKSAFFGTILTSLVWMAAYQRTKIPETVRKDFSIYVDEFQNFATPSFAELVSEGRKFHVSLIASHQNIAQIEDPNLLNVIAGNASTIICFKAGPDDEEFILPFMRPGVSKGDILNLGYYEFFMKTSGELSEDAFTGRTMPLGAEPNGSVAAQVKRRSRKRFAVAAGAVEDRIATLVSTTRLRTVGLTKANETNKSKPAGLLVEKVKKVGA